MNGYSPEFLKFLAWEQASRDTIDFKKVYVDVVGDLVAGLALSELIYWYLPDKSGESDKLRVQHDGQMWIACRRYEWWDRTRMSPKQSDRAIEVLKQSGIVVAKVYKFAGSPTVHIRLDQEKFLELLWEIIENPPDNPFFPKGGNRNSPKGEIEIPQRSKTTSTKGRNRNSPKGENDFARKDKSLTKTTPQTTTEITTEGGGRARQTVRDRDGKTNFPPPTDEKVNEVDEIEEAKEITLYRQATGQLPPKRDWKKIAVNLGNLAPDFHAVAPEYLNLYQSITGNELGAEVKVNQWPSIIAAIHQLPADKRTRDYLLPYWQKWCAINASPFNVEWLTDCAVNGRMPGGKKANATATSPAGGNDAGPKRRYADERYRKQPR